METYDAGLFAWRGPHGAADASDLGWRPGETPRAFRLKGKGATLEFRLSDAERRGGEVVGWDYVSVGARRMTVTVAND